MLDVYFTVDVEIWCDGWEDIDAKFPLCFKKYVYGPTSRGNYGLPYQLRVLADHGLAGVFFVEPLFAARFGVAPLVEIVGLIKEGGQEIQLHLHTEWVDEATEPLLQNTSGKRQLLRHFSADEQARLIAVGRKWLERAGADRITAFRAGNFGFNADTLGALVRNRIHIDSSYNASVRGIDSGIFPGTVGTDVTACAGVYEFPLTVFGDPRRGLRHAQLTACSFWELEGLLWRALEEGRKSFVILSHNFELMNPTKTRPDDVVIARFLKLCRFVSRNDDVFRMGGFTAAPTALAAVQPPPLSSPSWKAAARMVEQAYRRRYR
jgi:hypothetical protein